MKPMVSMPPAKWWAFSTTSAGENHAFIWQRGTMTDLGTLGGTESAAFGINDNGQVVGMITINAEESRAFVWENGHDGARPRIQWWSGLGSGQRD